MGLCDYPELYGWWMYITGIILKNADVVSFFFGYFLMNENLKWSYLTFLGISGLMNVKRRCSLIVGISCHLNQLNNNNLHIIR